MEIQHHFQKIVPKDVSFLKRTSSDPNVNHILGLGNSVFYSVGFFPWSLGPSVLFYSVYIMRLCIHVFL